MRKNNCVLSTCICQTCGFEIEIPRTKGKQRMKGHIKDMYCPICKRDSKFVELNNRGAYKNMMGEYIL